MVIFFGKTSDVANIPSELALKDSFLRESFFFKLNSGT